MKCTHPKRLWISSLWNYMDVPCGHCMACRLNYTKQWAIRMMNEASEYTDNTFITLTYNDENLPLDKSVHKEDVQKFVKRLRKYLGDLKIKYVACGEYGGQFGRPHYHLIVFNWKPEDGYNWRVTSKKQRSYRSPTLEKLWPYGNVEFGDVTFDSCRYVASYIIKQHRGKDKKYYEENNIKPEFVLMSQGLGRRYCERNFFKLKSDGYVLFNGFKAPLPRYYEQILFKTDEEKECRRNVKRKFLEKSVELFRTKLSKNLFKSFKELYNRRGLRLSWDTFCSWQEFENNRCREKRLNDMINKRRK